MTAYLTKIFSSRIVRWAVGSVLVALVTWFGGNQIKKTVIEASQFEQEKLAREADAVKYQEVIASEKIARGIAEVNAIKSDQRREEWRQGYYKISGEYDDYKQKTKLWLIDRYPNELDGLPEFEQEQDISD